MYAKQDPVFTLHGMHGLLFAINEIFISEEKDGEWNFQHVVEFTVA